MWPPAAAISSARTSPLWPRTSARSGPSRRPRRRGGARRRRAPRRAAQHVDRLAQRLDPEHLQLRHERRLARAAAREQSRARPCARGASASASAPRTAAARRRATARPRRRTPPARAGRAARWPPAPPTASGRSKCGPSLRRYAGARLTVMRFCGNSKPEFVIAARTRSRASRTALSASPTIVNAGRPRRMSHSTQTRRASTPSIANVVTAASTSERPFEVVEARPARRASSTITPIASKRSSRSTGASRTSAS